MAQLCADRVLNSIPAGLLIATCAWLLLKLVGRQNSGTRFAIWFSALLAVVAVPFVPALSQGGTASAALRPEITMPGSWAVVILASWALIAALAAARVAFGFYRLRWLRRNCVAITTSDLHPALRETVARIKTNRPVAIYSSRHVPVPTAIGFFKPMILIPEWALQELSAEELEVVLLHEFAHLRRWDDWTNLAQKIVRVIFFFHPAVWWIERRLSLEREMACDDLVLSETENPRVYAECLVALAEKSFVRRGLALAQAAISHARETSLRLAQILDVNRPNATRVFKPALGVVAAFLALCLVVLPDAPRLIAFENPSPPHVYTLSEVVPRLPQASVVPAMARIDSNSIAQSATRRTPAPAVKRPAKSSQLVAVKHKVDLPPGPPVFVRTAVKQPIPAPQFLLVMQTAEYHGRGSAIVTFSVWRVTFSPQYQNAVQPKIEAESI
jgi:beta-lactamase regulating signal transducer with metallopeptidase domain